MPKSELFGMVHERLSIWKHVWKHMISQIHLNSNENVTFRVYAFKQWSSWLSCQMIMYVRTEVSSNGCAFSHHFYFQRVPSKVLSCVCVCVVRVLVCCILCLIPIHCSFSHSYRTVHCTLFSFRPKKRRHFDVPESSFKRYTVCNCKKLCFDVLWIAQRTHEISLFFFVRSPSSNPNKIWLKKFLFFICSIQSWCEIWWRDVVKRYLTTAINLCVREQIPTIRATPNQQLKETRFCVIRIPILAFFLASS